MLGLELFRAFFPPFRAAEVAPAPHLPAPPPSPVGLEARVATLESQVRILGSQVRALRREHSAAPPANDWRSKVDWDRVEGAREE